MEISLLLTLDLVTLNFTLSIAHSLCQLTVGVPWLFQYFWKSLNLPYPNLPSKWFDSLLGWFPLLTKLIKVIDKYFFVPNEIFPHKYFSIKKSLWHNWNEAYRKCEKSLFISNSSIKVSDSSKWAKNDPLGSSSILSQVQKNYFQPFSSLFLIVQKSKIIS